VRKLTDSEVLIGLSSQMFEVGWLMPQLLVARYLVRVSNKKWWFVGPNIPVRTLMILFAGVILLLGTGRPGALLACFFLFYGLSALGDGLVGVPWVDLIGSSLDNRRRAQMFGMGTALSGVIVFFGTASIVQFVLSDSGPDYPDNYALLFGLSGLIFLITVPFGILIHELPGGQAREEIPAMRDYLPGLLRVLREDHAFRSMMIARVLATLFTMAGPFYIGFATERLDMSSDVAVSNLLRMHTLGSVSGALLFSWLGERQTLRFIRFALIIGLLQPALALAASQLGPAPLYLAFLAAGVVGGSLGISFINWVIMHATPDQRPIYSGLFNSLSAVGLLTAPLIGGMLVETLDYEAVFIAALVMVLGALIVALRHTDSRAGV
jgi:MFS family permease